MSLNLDARQRAMLQEMGVRVHAPLRDAGAPAPQAAPGMAPVAAQRVIPATASHAGPPVRPVPPSRPVGRGAPAQAGPAAPSPSSVGLDPRPAGIGVMDWAALQAAVEGCRACKLCTGRTRTVFGVGDLHPKVLVVGEAPGEHEDRQGEPFVGQAGRLLDNMLLAIGLARGEGVYIANVLKCRPPANRNPEPDEVAQCEPFLRRQVALLQPRLILAMGKFAVQSLLQTQEAIGRLRGREHSYEGVPLVVTYHPAYLLRNLPEKARAWADLCQVRELLQR